MSTSIVKHKRGTSTQWASATYVLKDGEIGIDKTLNKIKVGNGSSLWAALPFINVLPSELTELAQDAVELAITAGTGITKTYNDTANTITLAVDSTIANKTYVDTAVSGLSSTSATTYIPLSLLGQVDGVAELDQNGLVPDSQIPSEITRNTVAQTLTNKTIGLGTGITSIYGVDNIEGLAGQTNIPIYQAGLDRGGRINISSLGVISVTNSGIGYVSGLVTNAGGTRFNITVGGNTLSGTLAEFNAALTDGDFATESYVTTAVSNILDTAPETLNTLNELAAAINDDASFASTITTALGTKEPTLPLQTGNSGKFLTTDGTSKSWATISQFSLPTQTSNSGKYLTTDGTTPSWAIITQPSAATPTARGTVFGRTDSFYNVSLGENALPALTTGAGNIAIGDFANGQTTDQVSNIAIGYNTLITLASDSNLNVAIGTNALGGAGTLTGSNNVALGGNAGYGGLTGSNNTLLGANAMPSNSTVSNQITLGNSSITNFRIPGLAVNWTTSAYGRATWASTSAPSGGNDGDTWLVYTP
jgi:hypothetical protein